MLPSQEVMGTCLPRQEASNSKGTSHIPYPECPLLGWSHLGNEMCGSPSPVFWVLPCNASVLQSWPPSDFCGSLWPEAVAGHFCPWDHILSVTPLSLLECLVVGSCYLIQAGPAGRCLGRDAALGFISIGSQMPCDLCRTALLAF